MRIGFQLAAAGLLLVFSLAAWLVLLARVDPAGASFSTLALFYLVLLIAASTLFGILGFLLRRLLLLGRGERYYVWRTARRQGLWFGLILVSGLLLLSQDLLKIWTAASLFIVFGLIELYATTR